LQASERLQRKETPRGDILNDEDRGRVNRSLKKTKNWRKRRRIGGANKGKTILLRTDPLFGGETVISPELWERNDSGKNRRKGRGKTKWCPGAAKRRGGETQSKGEGFFYR